MQIRETMKRVLSNVRFQLSQRIYPRLEIGGLKVPPPQALGLASLASDASIFAASQVPVRKKSSSRNVF